MNRAELDQKIAEDEAVALVIQAWSEFAGDLEQLKWSLHKAYQIGHVAGYRDGLAAGQAAKETPQAANVPPAQVIPLLCPTCGANWTAMAEMLAELPTWELIERPVGGLRCLVETDNHSMARHIIQNCGACGEHFANPLSVLRRP